MTSDHDHEHADRVGTTAEGYPLHGDSTAADDAAAADAADPRTEGATDVAANRTDMETRHRTDLTAGAAVREEELDQVHQRIPDTHQSGF